MSILPLNRNLDQANPARPAFSIAVLGPIASIPFAPAVASHPSDFPSDILSISPAARAAADFVLHSGDDIDDLRADDATATHDDAAHAAAFILPMGCPTDASDPIDTLTFISVDSDYLPTPGDEAWHLAYTLEASGIEASPPAEVAHDRDAGLRWSRGKYAARDARAVRLAREAAEAREKALNLAYDQGVGRGYADPGAEPIVPHGLTPAEAEQYLAGMDAGADIRFRELAEAREAWDDLDAYGRQVVAAIAEDERDGGYGRGDDEFSILG